MRHAALLEELDASVRDHAVRVVLLTTPRGAGLTSTLHAFAEELRGRGQRAELTDTECVGVQRGGALASLLRGRLGLDVAARSSRVLEAIDTASRASSPRPGSCWPSPWATPATTSRPPASTTPAGGKALWPR